jgi:hypothetical protein
MNLPKPKIKPEFKLAHDLLDLKTADTNLIIEQLEENIRRREMSEMRSLFDRLVRISEHARQSSIVDMPIEKQLQARAKRQPATNNSS